MFLRKNDQRINFKQFYLGITCLLLLTSCSSQNNSSIEIISTPTLPEEYPLFPDEPVDPELNKLTSSSEIIKRVTVGRKDPFLPPNTKTNELFIPNSFTYHGQIASKGVVNAFISYQERSGIVKPGDIGGKTTNLLPDGWVMSKLNQTTNDITLKYEENSIDIKLFSTKK